MPGAYMYAIRSDGLRSDYKPTYEDFIRGKDSCTYFRIGDSYSRRQGFETLDGVTKDVVRVYQTFTGHNARAFLLDRPEFVFIEYREIISYYRVSDYFPSKTIVELVFKELLYDLKSNSPDKWVG